MELHKLFTYGVEIEGLFTKQLLKDLSKKTKVHKTQDGSVNYRDILTKVKERKELAGERYENELFTEINVGVFKTKENLLKTLDLIKANKNYFFDNSCGLHLHIKPKNDNGDLRKKIESFELLKKLQKYVFTELCQCLKQRENNHYCQSYKKVENTRYDLAFSEKYRFMRNHNDYETYEFRFLTPCDHKTENIKRFLTYLFTELEKDEPIKTTCYLPLLDITEIKTTMELKNETTETIDFNFKIGQPTRPRGYYIGSYNGTLLYYDSLIEPTPINLRILYEQQRRENNIF
jgi:hypothetical protein